MSIDRDAIYVEPELFFEMSGSNLMRLSSAAAIAVCHYAAARGLLITRIEGGVWGNPGFGSRLDCIWNGSDPPASAPDAEANNEEAARFIEQASPPHDVFILQAPPMLGWSHRR